MKYAQSKGDSNRMRQHVAKFSFLLILSLGLALTLASGCQSQQSTHRPIGEALQISDADGGSVVTSLSRSIQVNEGSTVHRRWYVLNDSSGPLQLSEAGIRTVYRESSIGGDYAYLPLGKVTAKVPVAAYEVRYLLFDMWGNHMQTLSATTVTDFTGERSIAKDGSWRAWENDVSTMLTVVALVAHVRTTDGKLWEYDHRKVLDALQQVKVKLTEQELNPEKEKPKP